MGHRLGAPKLESKNKSKVGIRLIHSHSEEIEMRKYITVTCWGSRGSCPAPYRNRMEYGGNTTCFVIETESAVLILDGGTGLVPFGEMLIGRQVERKRELHLLLSHLHLDHIAGIPSFKPIYQPEYQVWIYGGQRTGRVLEEQLETVFGPPYWPVRLRDCPAYAGSYGIAVDEEIRLPGDITVRAVKANHPDGAVLYEIAVGGKKIVYGLDCELNEEMESSFASHAYGADLIICDAQYSPEDYARHRGWGHSAWPGWVELAGRCRVGEIWLSHFAWEYQDRQMREIENEIRVVCPRALCAKEGMTIQL